MSVKEAVIAVTARCNARCAMCDFWQRKDDADKQVEPSYYYNLPKTLNNINITGGEPFLRKDLPEILMVMSERCKGLRPVISTNGLLTARIAEMAPRLLRINPRTAVRVSIDGIGKVHDKIRGIDGAFEKATASLRALISAGVKDLGLGFTLMADNQEQLMDVYELSVKMGIQFTSTVVHSSPIFFGEQEDQSPDPEKAVAAYSALMIRQLKSGHPKNWFRAYFTDGVVDMLSGKPRKIVCPALESFFFLSPEGEVFPCHILAEPLGRLDETPYEELVAKVPGGARKYRCCSKQCWMTCTVAPQMRAQPWEVLAWALRKKAGLIFSPGSPR